jgi:hypothetical protein
MKHQVRLAVVALLNLQIAHAETVVARYVRMVERPRTGGGDGPRWADGKLRDARERLARLGRSRNAILAGGPGESTEGGNGPPPLP